MAADRDLLSLVGSELKQALAWMKKTRLAMQADNLPLADQALRRAIEHAELASTYHEEAFPGGDLLH